MTTTNKTDLQQQQSRITNIPDDFTVKQVDTNNQDNQYQLHQNESACPSPEKILKVVFATFLFLAVTGSGFVARITLHILLWHLNPPNQKEGSELNTLGGGIQYNCIGKINYSTNGTNLDDSAIIDDTWIWAVFIVIIAPYFLTVLSSLFRIIFKTNTPIQWNVFALVMLVETFHTIGISILAFLVLPLFDPASASVVYLAVIVAPPLFDIIDNVVDERKEKESIRIICCKEYSKFSCFFAINGLVLQIAAIILISVYITDSRLIALFVVGSLCVSIKHWDNFITMGNQNSIGLRGYKQQYQKGRTKVTFFVNLWKILLTFVAVIATFVSRGKNSTEAFKSLFDTGSSAIDTFFGTKQIGDDTSCEIQVPFIIAIINIVCDYVCYKAAKTACVINCQRFGLSIPVALIPIATTFTLVGLLFVPDVLRYGSCDLLFSDWCLKNIDQLENITELIVSFGLLYLSVLVINRHLWTDNGARHGETGRIFVSPFYCGVFLDLSLALNRRRNDAEYDVVIGKDNKTESQKTRKPIKLYACCATMWHETANEMTQLLKSIYRLDKRQGINKLIAENSDGGDDDDDEEVQTFDLEAHIFFDDAFEPLKEGEKYPEANEYVRELNRVLEIAGSLVYGKQIELQDRYKYRTPYGARIEWILPAGNKLMVHLKDKNKIRHKKRWSQVMYMFYILKWKLLKEAGESGLCEAAENSYLLALDGDVDFEPEAVLSLVRRLKKSPVVGAACGRIHPIGSGPMVWYQKFEYAVSHWLQKATEHVIGCVLCSPGCFSLFRGSAILSSKVLETYTTIPSEAQHYVQYDQGEDRWLCTLLLKQGWKVEYCAESDSYTYAPEGFYEFFNQRRRWTPSTMANILDLIVDWRELTKNNENISFLYICYHVFMFVSTLLTPGTIFMLIVGAILLGFQSIPPWLSLVLNVVPVSVFLLMCLYTSTQRQLQFAAILSSIYAIVMVIVLIGVVRDAIQDGLCSMTTIFLIFVVGVFVISALLHPKEITCIFPGLLYFIAIPSMSMLMFLYSIGNLHVVSWGTRETKQTTETKTEKKTFVPGKEESGYFFSFGNFFSCICCPSNTYSKEDFLYKMVSDKMKGIIPETTNPPEQEAEVKSDTDLEKDTRITEQQEETVPVQAEVPKRKRKDKLRDKCRIQLDSTVPRISRAEIKFWRKTIKNYLQPLEKDEKKEKEIKDQLIDLRNRVCLFVFLLNAILVTIMFALTQVDTFKHTLSITFTCRGNNVEIVPISVLFAVVFGLLLLLQFVCMLYHRFSTLMHITAETNLIDNDKQKMKKIRDNIFEFLTTPSIAQPPKDTVLSDKNRSILDQNRKLLLPENTKPVKDLKEVVEIQMKRLSGIEGSLYGKRKILVDNVLAKWRKKPVIKPTLRTVVNETRSNRRVTPHPGYDKVASDNEKRPRTPSMSSSD